MKKEFCTYEIAKKLKELGFDKQCADQYALDFSGKQELYKYGNKERRNHSVKIIECLPAPLWQQAIDWLREEHKIFVHVEPEHDFKTLKYYRGQLVVSGRWLKLTEEFKTYEQAREAAIIKALELIK